jgi:general secretion pathway protein J
VLNPKPIRGFTLIEVLIAMTLLSIMVVLLFSSMRISAESWVKGEDKITEVNDVAVVYQFFQHHLTEARPLWDDFTGEYKLLAFQGDNQKLQFVSAFPASAKKAGLQLFSIRLANDGDEKILLVSIKPFFRVAEGDEWRTEEVTLLRHVKDFTLAYYQQDENQPEGMWLDSWLEIETHPKLVKVKIERDDGSFWPEMIIALKATGIVGNPNTDSLQDQTQSIDFNNGSYGNQ